MGDTVAAAARNQAAGVHGVMKKPISRKTVRRDPTGVPVGLSVYAHVKGLLLEGAYRKVDWIPVEQIATDLGVSRQPVMDAIKRLAADGFVEIVPQVGSRLRAYEEQDIRDFFGLFAIGEAYVARLAAERATDEDVVTLRLLSAQIGALDRLKRTPEERGRLYQKLNRKLHLEIRNAARSIPVGELVETMRDRSDFFIRWAHDTTFAERIALAFGEHEAIIDAIEAHDPDAAEAAMRAHIMAVDEEISRRTAVVAPRAAVG